MLSCFKAYDIRGQLGNELDTDIAYRIGRAFAEYLKAKCVVIGGDNRHSSPSLKHALAHGLIDAGVKVIDIGQVGTEEVYFASFHLDVDGGIEVTASHNPIDYNGMKLVGRDAKPISGDSGLRKIQELAEQFHSPYKQHGDPTPSQGNSADNQTTHLDSLLINPLYTQESILEPYVNHILSYINIENLRPLRFVVNAGNGAAGHVIDAIEREFLRERIPVEFIKIQHDPDGSFPNGIPNPLIPENRQATIDALNTFKADMGIAWDGDFDRCFLFDETGRFTEGYYIVGLLAEAFLQKKTDEKIIHDPRLTWNTIDQVINAGGTPVMSKTGHAFIKERMRSEDAIYGGEMSAHHYFRDFAYCDSGMIPWLLVAELMSTSNRPLSELVDERISLYPCSGELNYKVENVTNTLKRILNFYSDCATHFDYTDGISLEFSQWRFNLRASNTEPLLRLNVESKGNVKLVQEKVTEIESLIHSS